MLDSTNDTLTQVLYPTDNSLKICASENQSVKSGESSVIAKVTFGKGNKEDNCIVEFDKCSA